jgi:hypothetical protein
MGYGGVLEGGAKRKQKKTLASKEQYKREIHLLRTQTSFAPVLHLRWEGKSLRETVMVVGEEPVRILTY